MSTVGRLTVYGGRIVNLPRYRFVLASTLIVHGGTCGMPLAQRSFPPIPVPKVIPPRTAVLSESNPLPPIYLLAGPSPLRLSTLSHLSFMRDNTDYFLLTYFL
jgi:hypothetical protein